MTDKDYELIGLVAVPFILSSLAFYLAWFRPDIYREYLRLNSQIFGGSQRGRAWLASKYYFWMMRGVVTCLFILILILVTLALREIFFK